jgi:hypothetical protein
MYFGTSHLKPWCTKGSHGSIHKESNDAQEKCVCMDQIVFAQPGLIPQMSGFLTNLCIWGAMIFVDHFLDYIYVALMHNLTLGETLLARSSFERHAMMEKLMAIPIKLMMVNLLMLVFNKQSKRQIRL